MRSKHGSLCRAAPRARCTRVEDRLALARQGGAAARYLVRGARRLEQPLCQRHQPTGPAPRRPGVPARRAHTLAAHRHAPRVGATLRDHASVLRLPSSLDLDSFDFLNLLIALNERLGGEVPVTDYRLVDSLNGLVDYLSM